jgi:predicted lipoprotein with Yx(FWY)xxD motif
MNTRNLWLGIIALTAVNATAGSLTQVKKVEASGTEVSAIATPSGLTLYTFDPDAGAAKPTCNATCAEKWPPYLLTAEEVKTIQEENGLALGVATRDSGLKQLTIQGKPVYLYFADRDSEDAYGDGLGGVWHVIVLP